MRFPLTFMVRITRTNAPSHEPQGMVTIVTRRPYAHLEANLRKAFEGNGDIRVFVDRRYGERRLSAEPVPVERRKGDRRRPAEEIAEFTIADLAIVPTQT